MSYEDPFDLARFVSAQADVYADVERELRAGQKKSHWMWFIFPQLAGLGQSEMARRFALRSIEEAEAYVAHPILGARLMACTGWVNAIATETGPTKSAHDIFGSPDDLKFHSSMTLFAAAAPDKPMFATALWRYFDHRPDPKTVALLG